MGEQQTRSVGTRTVLFTDVVDSTALRSTLGDTEADDLDASLRRLYDQAVASHGGTIVKSLGDGIMATFEGAAHGIAAAIELQVRIRDRNTRHPAVGIRVGVSTGDVSTSGDGDHSGTPVVEAARLCAAAEPGQILISDVVRVLAGSRSTDDLVELGPKDYKGLPRPLVTWEVRWDAAATPVADLPMALRYDDGLPFVGRVQERGRLDAAWRRALDGQLTMVLIGGEPGAGKTRLTSELAQSALATGATLLFGSCEDGLGVPHQPFVECIRSLVAATPVPRLGPQAGELARLVPELTELIPDLPAPLRSDPETERYQLFNAVVGLLDDLAADAPVVMVLDDLHWATPPTLQLLRHVVRSKLGAPVLIVGTFRSTDVDEQHPLTEAMADLHRSEAVERLDLVGLETGCVRDYLEAIAGYELDDRADALAARVHAETDGNPFFMREVLLHLVESGHLYVVDGQWEADAAYLDAVPARARDVITQRLARLGDDARSLLARAAVVGLDFQLGILARLTDRDGDSIFDAMERATAARLVQEVGVDQYRFTHALVRSALLDSLSASRRARLHRQVAEALEDASHGTNEAVEDLADHWVAAGEAGDPAKAIRYLRLSAERAGDQLAHDAAANLLRRALELGRSTGADERTEAQLLAELGAAQRRAGDPGSRETLLDASRLAHRAGARDVLVRSVLENARTAAVLEVDDERLALLELTLDAIGDELVPERARLLACLGFELSFTHDRERWTALIDEALGVARAAGNLADLAFVLSMRVSAFRGPDTLAERLDACEEIEAISAQLDDPAMHFLASFRRAQVLLDAGDTGAFRTAVATMSDLSDRLGQPLMAWNTARRRAELALLEGDLDAAELRSAEMRKIGLDLQLPNAEPIYVSFVAKLFNVMGRPDRSVDLWAAWADRIHLIGFGFGLAHALFLAGRPEEAKERWERAAIVSLADLERDPWWLETVGIAAEVACDLGDRRRSAVLAEVFAAHGHRHIITSGVGALCSSDHALGVALLGAGDLDGAVTALRSAVEHGREVEAPLLAAASEVRLADALLRRAGAGDEEQARALLDAVLRTARQHGAHGLLAAAARVAPTHTDGSP